MKTSVNQAEAVALLVDRLRLDPEVAGRCCDIFADPAGGFATDARLDLDGFKNVLKLRAGLEGQWGGTPPPPHRYLDLSYYARAPGCDWEGQGFAPGAGAPAGVGTANAWRWRRVFRWCRASASSMECECVRLPSRFAIATNC